MSADDRLDLIDRLTGGCGCHGCRVAIPRLVDAMLYIGDEAAQQRRGLRGSLPTPVHGVDAGLLMLELAAAHASGREIPANQALHRRPRLRVAS